MWLYNSFIEFWPYQPTLSIFFYPGQESSHLVLFCISFLTSSTQRVFGLPIGLHEIGFQEYIAFNILVPCFLSMWPSSQLSLCARMKFIMFLCFIISSSSWLVFMRHIPFSLFGPNIFLKIFLSNNFINFINYGYHFIIHMTYCRKIWILCMRWAEF